MDIRYLQYFLIIAEKQSISAAARAIFIEQSSLSKIISKLEEHYKATLFERTPHGVKLTESGEILLEYAKTITSTYRESLMKISRDHFSKLAVYYCSGLERWLIPAALNAFQQENPLTELELHCCSWQDMSILHTLSEPDIIISFSFAVKILPVMEKATLMYDPMVLGRLTQPPACRPRICHSGGNISSHIHLRRQHGNGVDGFHVSGKRHKA